MLDRAHLLADATARRAAEVALNPPAGRNSGRPALYPFAPERGDGTGLLREEARILLHLSDNNLTTRLPVVLDGSSQAVTDFLSEEATPVLVLNSHRKRSGESLDPWHCACGLRVATSRRLRDPNCQCGTNILASVGITKRTRTVRPLVSEFDPIVRMRVFDDTHEEIGEVYAVSTSDIGSVRSRWAIGIATAIEEGDVDFNHHGTRYRFVRFFSELGWLQDLRASPERQLLLVQGRRVLRICDALINCDNAPLDLVVERVVPGRDR